MGLAKASLEASVRYLAVSLGKEGHRVNAISAGPIKTLAASGVKNFRKMLSYNASRSPIGRNITTREVGDAASFNIGYGKWYKWRSSLCRWRI